MNNDLIKVISNYHTALMGDDRNEINEAEKAYSLAQKTYGVEAITTAVKYYNENVINKA